MDNLNLGQETGESAGSNREYREAMGIGSHIRHPTRPQAPQSQSNNSLLLHMLEEMRKQNAALMARLEAREPSSVPPPLSPSIPRPRLPPLHEFDGNRSQYAAWRIEVDSKLTIDKEAIGGGKAAIATVFAALVGPARTTCATKVAEILKSEKPKARDLCQYLDECYLDQHAQQQAMRKLNVLRQGQRPFSVYLPEFERILHEAGGASWPEAVKIDKFKETLSKDLLLAVSVVAELPNTLHGWIKYLSKVSSEREYLLGKPTGMTRASSATISTPPPDPMDWEPTRVSVVNANGCDGPGLASDHQLRGKRAKWVERSILEDRKNQGTCLRCARKGCSTRQCPLAAARRPRDSRATRPVAATVVANTLTMEEVSAVVDESGTDANLQGATKKRITSEQSRPRRSERVQDEWQNFRQVMDGPPFRVEICIENTSIVHALIDHGCSAFATISENTATSLNLARVSVKPPKGVHGVGGPQGTITQAAHANVDIGGHNQGPIFFYIIPRQTEPVILGIPWIRKENVVLEPKERHLRIKSSGIIVKEIGWDKDLPRPSPISSFQLRALYQTEGVSLFKASLADITKALSVKPKTDLQAALPLQYQEYADVFEEKEGNELPPSRKGIDMKIQLEKDEHNQERAVPWGPLYSMSQDELLVLRKTLTGLLDKGFIRVSNSPARAPVLFARKPGGGLRFCCDYRALNEISVKDRYPLPLIRDTLQQVSSASLFTKLDVRAAFHRIRVAEGDEWKTAFGTRYGSFEWLAVPFGLANGPAVFQRFINWILRDRLDIDVTAYMDDIIIYTNGDLSAHRQRVIDVLSRLRAAGLVLDFNKCAFEVKEVKYLGFIIKAGQGIEMDPGKLKAIQEWEAPTTVKKVRAFLGFANFYRPFIQNFAERSSPLTFLTRKNVPFIWGPEQQVAFDDLKEEFCREPVLANWDPTRPTFVETDASGYAIGGCLQQEINGERHPIAYFSRKMTAAETNYPIHDKELLAVVEGVKEWRAELRSVPQFIIITDHHNLSYFKKKQNLSERQVRWLERLEELPPFTIEYRPGKLAHVPDALSRKDKEDNHNRHLRLWQDKWEKDQPVKIYETAVEDIRVFDDEGLHQLWRKAIDLDTDYKQIIEAISDGDTTKFPAGLGLQAAAQMGDSSINAQGLPTYRGALWLPDYEPLTTAVIQQAHDSLETGHPGRDGTIAILRRQFFWPRLSRQVRTFVGACNGCGRSKIWRSKKHGLLQPLEISDRPWQIISMDFMTHLPKSGRFENLLVVTERLTGALILEPMSRIDAESVARVFLTAIYRHHGPPKAIVSDRGSQFVGAFWKTFCEHLGIQRKLSTAYHPQTDGGTERANQEVQAYLRQFLTLSQNDWADRLPAAQLALNNRPGKGGVSAFFAGHGFNVNPVHLTIETGLEASEGSAIGNAERLSSKLQETGQWISAAVAAAQQQMEDSARRTAAEDFKVGDRVWLDLRHIKTARPCKKLDWLHATFTITRKIAPMTYELDVPMSVHNRFHSDLLRRTEKGLPSQITDILQPEGMRSTDDNEDWTVEAVLCGRSSSGKREALCRWKGIAEPTWIDSEKLQGTQPLDDWEAKWGPIKENDGPWENWMDISDPPRRRGGRYKRASRKKREEEDIVAG